MSEPISIELSRETRRNLARIAAKEGVEFEEAIQWALQLGLRTLRIEESGNGRQPSSWGDMGSVGGGK